jgi:predicted metal-binding membrane protein
MRLSRNIRIGIPLLIISISVFVWVLLLANPGNMTMEHCHVSVSGPSAASLEMLLEMNPVSTQLFGWGLMVVAMMLPKLIVPIQQIYAQSLRRYRFVNAFLFVTGYLIIWMLAGVPTIAVIIGSNLLMPMSYVPALVIFILAVIWQFTPIKQRFLNLGHDHQVLSAFGWNSLRDALMFGFSHGVWCVGAGWALMLFPMLLPVGHNAAMLVVTFIMLSEHMEHPRSPGWYFGARLKLWRIVVGQVRMRMMPGFGKRT